MSKFLRAAFLDRDGVLNADYGYVHSVDRFDLLPGVPVALRRLREAGFLLVVVTNQSGIARGMYTEDEYQSLTLHLHAILASESVWLDAVYHCPHLPDAVVPELRRHCDCRKPRPGMIHRACARFGIDASRSLLFGDKPSDIEAGRAAGVGWCCLVATGCADGVDANAIAPDLAAGVDAALGTGGVVFGGSASTRGRLDLPASKLVPSSLI